MTRILAALAPTPRAALTPDSARIRVRLHTDHGNLDIGNPDEAGNDSRLTPGERAAIRNLVTAVRLLRTRDQLLGIDDAGTGVTLVLRDPDATTGGPYASAGQISIGATNALALRSRVRADPGVLLPVDTAVHELTHVTQFARMPASATPDQGIMEGMADAVAILATGDDTLGEEYFRRDASGKHRGSIRDLGAHVVHGPTVGPVDRTYAQASAPGAEPHEAGGLVSTTVEAIRSSLGRTRTEQLLWKVIRDQVAWKTGGSWAALAAAFERAAADDPVAAAAVQVALHQTGLDAALAA